MSYGKILLVTSLGTLMSRLFFFSFLSFFFFGGEVGSSLSVCPLGSLVCWLTTWHWFCDSKGFDKTPVSKRITIRVRYGREGIPWLPVACTQALFIFSFRSSLPLALAVNKSPAFFIFHHARSMDFEEKIEGLWTGEGARDSSRAVSRLGFSKVFIVSDPKSAICQVKTTLLNVHCSLMCL